MLSTQASHLIEHKHDLLAPLADVAQELDFALCEGAVSAHHKQHQVRAGHKLLCQALLAIQNDIGACRGNR